jgi:hypothetical protein
MLCSSMRVGGGGISEVSAKVLGADFESVARFWVADNKHKALNVCSAAVLWVIWKLRNECCFQGARWEGVQVLLRKIARMIRDWSILNKQEVVVRLEEWMRDMEIFLIRGSFINIQESYIELIQLP